MAEGNIQQQNNYARVGLATDLIPDGIQKGYVTYTLNAVVGNFNGQSISFQNETGNVFSCILPQGYKVIGVKNITQLSQVLIFLTNPTIGFSMIGYVQYNSNTFVTLIDDSTLGSDLIGFNINNPIQKVEIKTTNCSTQFYWTDSVQPRYYVDLNNLPWKNGVFGVVDVNKMKVQPNFSVMTITPVEVVIGGNLIEGVYQFAACYSNVNSNQLTGYYSKTNPVSIFNNNIISPNFNDPTNKAIALEFDKLDTSGLYDYFSLAAIKTINGITSVDFVGNFNIQSKTFRFTYTGDQNNNNNIKLDMTVLLEQFPYYDVATDLTQVDDVLVWAGLTKEDPLNYQKIWNQVKVGWATSQVPVNSLEDYSNGIDSAILQGYMRDEVYVLEGCFILANGMQSSRFHIPGRMATPADLVPISTSNPDVEAIVNSTCTPPPSTVPTWQVYNTGSLTGFDPSYISGFNCPQPYQYGEMGYYESEVRYPNNPTIWGSLAGQPQRHHKFPDSLITHIHDRNPNSVGSSYNSFIHNIYPIGFKVDIQSLRNAITNSPDLTPYQKSQIVGFKIMRGDRGADKSIIAKGYFYNCGEYNNNGTSYYYANYPFNDTHPDVFLSSTPVNNKSGANVQTLLDNFQPNRFTFHSPDTHFYQPSGIVGSYVKMETCETGGCTSHFVPVLNNAREKIRTKDTLLIAFSLGLLSTIGVNFQSSTSVGTDTSEGVLITPKFTIENFFPTYNTTLDLLDKLSPYLNYAWQYNGVGYYGNYIDIPNNNNQKIRPISFGGYITSGLNGTFGDNFSINNTNRESSVYISIGGPNLPIAGRDIGLDNSRVTASGAGVCNSSTPFYTSTACYYGSIKRYIPDQYGEIFSYTPVDTGFYSTFVDDKGTPITVIPTIFGGDIFINRFALKIKQPFYNVTSVNKPDGYDINYNQDPDPTNLSQSLTNTGNIGFPIWYYSTSNITTNIANVFGPGLTNLTNLFNTVGGIAVLVLTGGIALVAVMMQLIFELFTGVLFNNLGLKVTNLECNNYSTDQLWETGMAYLYAYGIPYFFCESEVNVDMRLATNNKESNFFPQVGTDIPDSWLQETNVPIINDNSYNYNKTYSKENKETFFTLLRPDWEPNQTCYTNFNNRAIWSDKSDLEETKNNWLVYRPANLFDFPKGFGQLEAIDALENREVLVRFQNRSQIYNAMATIGTTALTASLGTGALFSGTQPIDLSSTTTGDYGTQNKFIVSTPYGHIWTDAERGQICLLQGRKVEDLSGEKYLNSKWFTQNMPFNILTTFPNIDIDNNFNGIGLHGVFDTLYKRLIVTKIDYTIINSSLLYDGSNFYINMLGGAMDSAIPNEKKIIIELGDPNYFCNQSWTMCFSFLTNSWISWHSYQPNFYIQQENYFQSGLNNGIFSSLWNHNKTFNVFHNYYGTSYPYILEYPFAYKGQKQEIIQSVSEECTVLRYTDFNQFVEPKENIFFNKSVIYSNQQCTGQLNLIPKSSRNLAQYISYPKYNANSVDILVAHSNNFYNYNMIWDKVKDPDTNIFLNLCSTTTGEKILNDLNLDYGTRSYQKYLIRSKDSKIRHTLDDRNDICLISKFIIVQTDQSYH